MHDLFKCLPGCRHRARHHRLPYPLWREVVTQSSLLATLSRRERARLRRLAGDFLHEKSFSGAGGQVLDDFIRAWIAAHACLLVLNLGLTGFHAFREVILYPDTFLVEREERDENGLVHRVRRPLLGEAWQRGPVILSWNDIRPGAQPHGPASNVILHEFAHKLDMLSGAANGMPPIHPDMDHAAWTAALSRAYRELHRQLEGHHHTAIDPYAAENPAEFFAVLSEIFFEAPDLLEQIYPAVYEQLRQFYRQDPLRRKPATTA